MPARRLAPRRANRGRRRLGLALAETDRIEGDSESPADLPEPDPRGPLRRCLATAAVRDKAELVRFVVGPEGAVVPDVDGRLPGKGMYLSAEAAAFARAVAKNPFARAARAPVRVPADLAALTAAALTRRCLAHLGLAKRSGQLVAGFDKVRESLKSGKVSVLVQACDASEDGRGRMRALATGLPAVERFTSAELAAAIGRDHVVHMVLTPGKLAKAFLADIARLDGLLPFVPETGATTAGRDPGKPQSGDRVVVPREEMDPETGMGGRTTRARG